MKLQSLAIGTGLLFILSLFVFFNENYRGTGLVAGSDYVKGLDINKIQKVFLAFHDDKKIIFSRDGRQFLLESHKSYPASIKKLNDLIYKIASIQIKEEIDDGPSEKDLEKYKLSEKNKRYLIEILDNEGRKTVSFRVGKSYKGKGHYLYKIGGDKIYLSMAPLSFSPSHKAFLDEILMDVSEGDIEKVAIFNHRHNGGEIELAKNGKDHILKKPPQKKFKDVKVKEYFSNFKALKFNDYFKTHDREVQNLNFDRTIQIQLKSKLIYKLSLAKKDKDRFLRMAALIDELPKQIVITENDDRKKLENIEDMARAQKKAQRINLEKGEWTYKIEKSSYDKLVKKTRDFL